MGMFRFIAFAWDVANPEQSTCARQLSQKVLADYGPNSGVLTCDGLAVHWAGVRDRSSESYRLWNDHGVVLGKLFEQSVADSPRHLQRVFDASQTVDIVASRGRALINHYWGRYVAFLRDPSVATTWVIRDPTGSLPCFMTSIDGVRVFFSRLEDCVRLGARFTVNWDCVLAQLATTPNEKLDGTGLNEVTPIHSGECIECREDRIVRAFYWDPFGIAANVIDDPKEAATQLRRTVRSCVHAWASCYDGIMHRLSGGLDSSIVAACLSDAPTRRRVTCFTHFSPGSDSDEREYARLVSQRGGFELVEHERDFATLDQLQRLALHPHPLYVRYFIDYGRFEASLAHERGAGAIFSGEWGDALFHSSPHEMQSAVDCAQLRGIGLPLFRAALDTSRLKSKLFWHVLWRATAGRMSSRREPDPRGETLARHRPLLAREAALRASHDGRYLHPWLKAADNVPPGKRWHIYQSVLLDLQPFYDLLGHEDDPEQVAPLNSQPIVELCLRIPTYVLVAGGWDRAIARRAFLDSLPREIATRRTKGGLEEYQKATFMRSIAFARESLLDGALVKQGLLDRPALEEALSGEPTRLASSLGELYWYLCTEAWLAQCHGAKQ